MESGYKLKASVLELLEDLLEALGFRSILRIVVGADVEDLKNVIVGSRELHVFAEERPCSDHVIQVITLLVILLIIAVVKIESLLDVSHFKCVRRAQRDALIKYQTKAESVDGND